MTANPVPIRSRPSASPASSISGSSSTSPRSSAFSTPPKYAQNFHPNSINHGSSRNRTEGVSPDESPRAREDAPFVGTPFAFALERPYEYPFPSPATESCPNLGLAMTATGVSFGPNQIPPPTQSLVNSPVKSSAALPPTLPSVLPPPVLPLHPPPARREGLPGGLPLFARRMSGYAPESQGPVPPGLMAKARDVNRRRNISGGAAILGALTKPSR